MRGQKKCESCAFGNRTGWICSCRPDPWQPLKAIEPDQINIEASPTLSAISSNSTPRSQPTVPHCDRPADFMLPDSFDFNIEKKPPEVMWKRNGQHLEWVEDESWRYLLHGTHAFSLPGANPKPLHAEDPEKAVTARHRQANVGWRRWSRWWLAQQVAQFDMTSPQYICPEVFFPSTPTATPPGTPRGDLKLLQDSLPVPQMPASVLPGTMQSSFGPQVQFGSTAVVFVPVPAHLVGPVMQYIEQLQSGPPSLPASPGTQS